MVGIRRLRSDSLCGGVVHSRTAFSVTENLSEGKMVHRIVGRVLVGAVGALSLLAVPATLSAQTTAVPTFTKDIAPIFQNKCESCHRPDSIAPMSLQTYEEARPWARSIRDRVASRNMPPW